MNAALISRHPNGHDAWVLWHTPREVLTASRADEVPAVLDRAEAAALQGRHALGFVTYEAGTAFDTRFVAHPPEPGLPLAWFAIFDSFVPCPFTDTCPSPCAWMPVETETRYQQKIAIIKDEIAAGATYQVNYTFPLQADRSPLMKSLFFNMFREQPTPYAMYIETPAFRVASVSPELFFRLDNHIITCEPMKGTARRAPHPALDDAAGEALRTSPKNRAENLMIVDMIRNDLGRIAATGSVHVNDLFKVTRYPTLWQMTTNVSARTGASLRDIFAALFPCASITGAPKLQTSAIIAGLEDQPRGLYTGAIGRIGPGRTARFAVAIRTATQSGNPLRTRYHVGSGIVWDSLADDEYHECLLKARILDERIAPAFQLLETLRWEPGYGWFQRDAHLARMAVSTRYYKFPFDLPSLETALDAHIRAQADIPQRVRLLLDVRGGISVESTPLDPQPFTHEPENAPELSAALDTERQDTSLACWYHKTTQRMPYEAARRRFPEADEVLLVNDRNELMEFTNGNLVARQGATWFTPPLGAGLLPGVFRQLLLDQHVLHEKTLTVTDLHTDTVLYFINSVRGWRRVRIRT